MTKNNSRRIWMAAAVMVAVTALTARDAVAQHVRPVGKAVGKSLDLSDRTITFQTSDGVEIEADWYPAKVEEREKSPVAILIHMYPATRSSWKPMVPLLRKELGISVLAYDIRGTGGSTKPESMELEKKYQERDAGHFAAAYQDTIAAYQWLSQQSNVDTSRLIVIGASVGCSISLEFASQGIDVKGVACLSPGTDYMGIDSISHIKALKDRNTKVLLISPEGEYDAVEALLKATDGADYARGKKYPGGRENHGTAMFDAKYGRKVKLRLQKFARGVLGIEKKSDKKPKSDKAEGGAAVG